jgi:hypothetical protein
LAIKNLTKKFPKVVKPRSKKINEPIMVEEKPVEKIIVPIKIF